MVFETVRRDSTFGRFLEIILNCPFATEKAYKDKCVSVLIVNIV